MANPWKKVEMNPTWDYSTQKEFVGLYIGKEENVGPNNSTLYNFEMPDHSNMSVWGSNVLDTRFKNLKEGEEVKIVYLGKEISQKTKKPYHNFEVYHRMPDFTAVDPGEEDLINKVEEEQGKK